MQLNWKVRLRYAESDMDRMEKQYPTCKLVVPGHIINTTCGLAVLGLLTWLVLPVDRTADLPGILALMAFNMMPFAGYALILHLFRKNLFPVLACLTGILVSAAIGLLVYIDALIVHKSLINMLVLITVPSLQLFITAGTLVTALILQFIARKQRAGLSKPAIK